MTHTNLANTIRFLAADAVQKANSGHPGMPMGMADVATILFQKHLKFDSKQPQWPDRDRFILSAGHGSMLLYALLYLTGYEDMTIEELKNFRQWGAKTAGHPEYGHASGIETTTGPLGQGLANAVGMALTEAMLAEKHGSDLVDHYTYVIAGDGCLMEGISHEAISFAGHMGLGKLIVFFDDNEICIDGATSLTCSEDHHKRFEAMGWEVISIDGHDPEAIDQAISTAKKSDKPSLIACKTQIGWGAPTKAGTSSTHGAPLGDDEIAAMRQKLNWNLQPFEVDSNVLQEWRAIGSRGSKDFTEWKKRLGEISSEKQSVFLNAIAKNLPENFQSSVIDFKNQMVENPETLATRKASQKCLDVLTKQIETMIGGSADLTGSNNTKAAHMSAVQKSNYDQQYIHYGVREHGMAAIMNGMSLHGGVIPYGATFLVFTDYCRPSIRLSALMKQQVIYVMTHDSIGLGEDGPTHQPIEHLSSLRSIPNVKVFRPADQVETLEAWQFALEHKEGPSIIALSRQNLPQLRLSKTEENLSAKGGYVIYSPELNRKDQKVAILSSGSEVHIAVEAAKELAEQNIFCKVVSVPSLETFEQQNEAYHQEVLGNCDLVVAFEAGHPQSWYKVIDGRGFAIGLEDFGASAPYQKLYEEFGLTKERLVKDISESLRAGSLKAI